MQEEQNQVNQPQPQTTQITPQPRKGILDKTLGEILHFDKEAQNKIMQGMHISSEEYQQMLGKTEGNPIANMTIRELFKSGFILQSLKQFGSSSQQQTSPQQGIGQTVQQIQGFQAQPNEEIETSGDELKRVVETQQNAKVLETDEMGNPTKVMVPLQQQQQQQQVQKQSTWDVVKGLFK